MTALNFLIQKDQICFTIDSLSVSAEDKSPLVYLTKFIVIPHLSMVVTGTGNANFIAGWMSLIRSNIIAKDIDQVNIYAQDALINMATEFPDIDKFTATIYHFGYSYNRTMYVGYAYRSVKNWQSDELVEGIGIKPPVNNIDLKNFELPNKFVEIMKLQREQDHNLPIEEKVGIGGDVYFVHMINEEVHISRCFRFPCYESDYDIMCNKIV